MCAARSLAEFGPPAPAATPRNSGVSVVCPCAGASGLSTRLYSLARSHLHQKDQWPSVYRNVSRFDDRNADRPLLVVFTAASLAYYVSKQKLICYDKASKLVRTGTQRSTKQRQWSHLRAKEIQVRFRSYDKQTKSKENRASLAFGFLFAFHWWLYFFHQYQLIV